MEEPLILKAQSAARDKLRTLALLRLSSAVALVLPAIACTFFLWAKTQAAAPDGIEDTGSMFYDVVWRVWFPLAAVALVTGAAFTWLGYNAWDEMGREYRFTDKGIERNGFSGRSELTWGTVQRVETGYDLFIRAPGEYWKLSHDWLGRENEEAVVAVFKARLPKNKILPAPSKMEKALHAGLKLLPAVFALLVAAILSVIAYWVLWKGRPEAADQLLRAAPGLE